MQFISWEHIDEYILKGIAAQLPVSANTGICFLVADGGRSIGLRIPIPKAMDIQSSPYREVDISCRTVHEKDVIELSVKDPALYSTFYHFCIEILQLILNEKVHTAQAIERCVGNWSKLLLQRKLLEETEQVGLAGELCLLRALIVGKGVESFSTWLGPIKGRHDFRLENNEIEVKSTLQSRRVHRIHGLGQLEPSRGMKLYMLSLQFEPAGKAKAGKTLVERITEVRNLLSAENSTLTAFNTYIEKLGYKDSDSSLYTQKLKFRAPPVIIPIDSEFPSLTRSVINRVMPEGASSRVKDVEYEVLVDGLGHPEGSQEYEKIMQGIGLLENVHD